MYGYRVYFDGKQFQVDNEPSEVNYSWDYGDKVDKIEAWFVSQYDAIRAVEHYNNQLNEVKQCTQCKSYSWQTTDEVEWFTSRGMKPPK